MDGDPGEFAACGDEREYGYHRYAVCTARCWKRARVPTTNAYSSYDRLCRSVLPLQSVAEPLLQIVKFDGDIAYAVDGQPVVAGGEILECLGR